MSYKFLGIEMPLLSILVGGILSAWGVAAYVISDMASVTAFIPTIMGTPIAVMGSAAAQMPSRRKLFMHIAVVFGLLCALGGLRLPMILMDADSSGILIISHALLLVLGGVFTYACIQSFRWARINGKLDSE
ncbi:MAG: hypothetical protein ACJZ49_00330 [Candidatus Thalassarchaeaceae archaeon]|nr:MAG: hypothetical protein CMA04_004775 [Euryarchaeota archaeon]RPG73617.1 MAG: hypothetical protein CBC45_006730 [Euryarchaeota archaeon TMED85]|tara:strand:- start:2614 stop:3009 length:396 start_codon:yes stop_codon:yes gene_type:complete